MYTNLTVLLSVFLLVNGLDLECSVDTIERLFASSSDEKCELCEILKNKLEITHCQSNLLPSPCFSNQHHLPQQFSFNNSNHLQRLSTHWDRTIVTNNDERHPLFHVLIRRNNNDDEEQTEYLYLTFNTYPKILPKVCQKRKHPIRSPFGHLCDPDEKCVEDSSTSTGYICQCRDECSKTRLTRHIMYSFYIGGIVLCGLIALYILSERKTKVMGLAMWPVTVAVLIGGSFLYLSGIFEIAIPSTAVFFNGCLTEPWTREIGFTLLYGGIILKIYRSLVEFRTRKAHRWVVREKDILRYLCTMSCVVVFYMTSWAVTNDYFAEEDFEDRLYCPTTWWHRVTELGELLFLCVGLNMAWHLRRANTPFRNFYFAAILTETTINIGGIIIRESRHLFVDKEDAGFLMAFHFIRCLLSVTIVLALVIAPKIYYIRDEKRTPTLRRGDTTTGGICAGRKALEDALNEEGGLPAINIAEMDPNEIRSELKRVYAQLEQLRNKTMRKDNPHISKRRGGRKPTHRRFSLQALRRQQQQPSQTTQHYQQNSSRSFRGYAHDDIEDSVCSIEGPSTYSEAGR